MTQFISRLGLPIASALTTVLLAGIVGAQGPDFDCKYSACSSAEGPTSNRKNHRATSAYAEDSGVHLFVWEDEGTNEVSVRMVNDDLDVGSRRVVATEAFRPSVATDGYGFLVVFEDLSFSPTTAVSAVYVAPDGFSEKYVISSSEAGASRPTAIYSAFADTFLVTWTNFGYVSSPWGATRGTNVMFKAFSPIGALFATPDVSVPVAGLLLAPSANGSSVPPPADTASFGVWHTPKAPGVNGNDPKFDYRRDTIHPRGFSLGERFYVAAVDSANTDLAGDDMFVHLTRRFPDQQALSAPYEVAHPLHEFNFKGRPSHRTWRVPGGAAQQRDLWGHRFMRDSVFPQPAVGGTDDQGRHLVMVVWDEIRGVPGHINPRQPGPGEDDPSVYGQCFRIDEDDGDIVALGNVIPISYDPNEHQTRPSVDYMPGDDSFLVAYNHRFCSTETCDDIRYRRVRCLPCDPREPNDCNAGSDLPHHEFLDEESFIDSGWDHGILPSVSAGDNGALIAWENSDTELMHLTRVYANGAQKTIAIGF